jgi:single-stranded-DNA-specific exonuclease
MQPVLKRRWNIAPVITPEASEQLKDFNPILRQLLFNRNVCTREEAERYLNNRGPMFDPFSMLGMEGAVYRILAAVDAGERIAVYGDFDVDGVTATALLVQVLQRFYRDRSEMVCGYIPNRFDEGYGLNEEALKYLFDTGYRLVITVDCGIRSPREAAFARELGMEMIISDHHEPFGVLPEVVSIICPKQPGDTYPDKNLAGVGLAFKMAEALISARSIPGTVLEDWLDLVAVGTVADVVPLFGENRALVRAGLESLRKCTRPGLCSLGQVAGLHLNRATARDIGFALGPRLNAAGRLESALLAYDLLMAPDFQTAGELSQKLDDQNRHRQELTRQMVSRAEVLLTADPQDHLMFAADESFNMGVVGLVASRLADIYYRPAIVGARGEEFTRASCRSIPEFNITKALDECADLMVRHGGHARAAGFTIKNENVPALRERLHEVALRQLGEMDLQPLINADLDLNLDDLSPALLTDLDALEPTGEKNSEALFISRNVLVREARLLGEGGKHLKLKVLSDHRVLYDAIGFQMAALAPEPNSRVDILYSFELNFYNGKASFQLRLRDLKSSN